MARAIDVAALAADPRPFLLHDALWDSDQLFGTRPYDARLILDATSRHRGLSSYDGHNRFGPIGAARALDWFRLWADQFSPRIQAAIAAGRPEQAVSAGHALDLIARAIDDDAMEARNARHA
ncbi:MAG: hypothetical protein RIB84_23735 [Sneathiellaceae bacterium]